MTGAVGSLLWIQTSPSGYTWLWPVNGVISGFIAAGVAVSVLVGVGADV